MGEAIFLIYVLPLKNTGSIGYVFLAQFGERQRWWRSVTLSELELGLRDHIHLDWEAVQQALMAEGTWSEMVPLSYEDAAKLHLV